MRQIHEMQLSYKDLSDKNVLVNQSTGDIVIIDNDNITENGKKTSMSGTPGYRAPEVLEKDSYPVRNTDLHSLAVLLFRIILGQHPLHTEAYYKVNQNDYINNMENYYENQNVFDVIICCVCQHFRRRKIYRLAADSGRRNETR
jgi:serine/threonine protein kinase